MHGPLLKSRLRCCRNAKKFTQGREDLLLAGLEMKYDLQQGNLGNPGRAASHEEIQQQ